jgi:hypothetical protein
MLDLLIADILTKPIFYFTMILSVSGAHLTSGTSQRLRGIGFAVWIISNGLIMIDYYINQNYPMTLTFLIYQGYNIRGVFNNLPWLKFW